MVAPRPPHAPCSTAPTGSSAGWARVGDRGVQPWGWERHPKPGRGFPGQGVQRWGELEGVLWAWEGGEVRRDFPKAGRGFGHPARLDVPLRAPKPLR